MSGNKRYLASSYRYDERHSIFVRQEMRLCCNKLLRISKATIVLFYDMQENHNNFQEKNR